MHLNRKCSSWERWPDRTRELPSADHMRRPLERNQSAVDVSPHLAGDAYNMVTWRRQWLGTLFVEHDVDRQVMVSKSVQCKRLCKAEEDG